MWPDHKERKMPEESQLLESSSPGTRLMNVEAIERSLVPAPVKLQPRERPQPEVPGELLLNS